MLSGLAWGGVAYPFAKVAGFGSEVGAGIIVSPFIGLLIGQLSKRWYRCGNAGLAVAVAGSVLIGSATFSATCSLAHNLLTNHPDPPIAALVLGGLAGVFGLIISELGLVIVVGLSVLNYLGMKRLWRRVAGIRSTT